MLINVRISELLTTSNNSIPLAIITVIAFAYSLYEVLPYNIATFGINVYINIMDYVKDTFLSFISKHFKSSDTSEVVFVTSKT